MRQVKFVSLYGQDEVSIIGKTFKDGEVKDLTDADAALVLSNDNFKDVTVTSSSAKAVVKPAASEG